MRAYGIFKNRNRQIASFSHDKVSKHSSFLFRFFVFKANTPERQPVNLVNQPYVGLLTVSPSRESVKRGKFKVCPGDVPYPLGAPEFEGSSPRAFPFQPAVSTAPAQKGRCVRPPPRHFTLPRRMPPAGAEERRGGKSGAGGPRPLPHPRAGSRRQPAGRAGLRCGGTERRGRRAQRPGPRTHQMGPRGHGVSATPETRASTALRRAGGLAGEARRDGPAASLPPLLSPSYKYRLGPHSPPPTPGALRKVRRPRTRQPERKGDGAAQVTAMAPAVRQPPQLEAWPPAAPALPAPSPPACAAGPLQPAGRARRAEPAPAGPASAEPAAAGGGTTWGAAEVGAGQAGWGTVGLPPSVSAAVPSSWGNPQTSYKIHHPAGNQ